KRNRVGSLKRKIIRLILYSGGDLIKPPMLMKNDKHKIVLNTLFIIWALLVPGIQTIGYFSAQYFSPFDYWAFPVLFSGLAFIPTIAIGPLATYWMFIVPFFIQWFLFFGLARLWVRKFHSSNSIVVLYVTIVCFMLVTGWLNYQMMDFIHRV
ncbi:MAG: hypothetical protein KAI63_00285, partial [Planctomycetes bacterium]|nr:hypothetical protein [Planctomycetota bacterium]